MRIAGGTLPGGVQVDGELIAWEPDAVTLLGRFSDHKVDACVGGGWAVDALLMEQTREHSDLDRWAPATHLDDCSPHSLRVARHAPGLGPRRR